MIGDGDSDVYDFWMERDAKMRFMVHKVLPWFFTMLIPWLLVFGLPMYVLTGIITAFSEDDWEFLGLEPLNSLCDACLVFFVTPFILYFSFMVGLFMIPFWLAIMPFKLFIAVMCH